jgi:hypothetical protein
VPFIGYAEEYFVLVVGNCPAKKTERKFFVVIKGICISGEIPEAYFLCRNKFGATNGWKVLCSSVLGKNRIYFVGFIWTRV